MRKRYYKLMLIVLIAAAFFGLPHFAFAQDIGLQHAENLGLSAGPGGDVRDWIVDIVRYLLTFLGIIAVVFVMYGGFVWMTAGGEPDRINKAKRILIEAAIGLVIVMSAFAIVAFIVNLTGDTIEGACTAGETRSCGCAGMGTKTCIAENTWGACSADCDYSGGEKCCAWGCSVSCLNPPSFNLNSTIPNDGAENVIRNVKISFNFSRTVDADSFTDADFLVTDDAGSPIPGNRSVDGRRITFSPAQGCGENPCGATNCFDSGQKVSVKALDGADGILSIGDIPLSCPMGSGCEIDFTVGDLIDCQAPKARLDFTQICAMADNELFADASDDNGLAMLEFFVNNSTIIDPSNPIDLSGEPAVSTRALAHPVYWDAGALPEGSPVTVKIAADDISGKSGEDEKTYKLRPEHCCNGLLDDGEAGIDCGGECAACEGAACGISLAQACSAIDKSNCDDASCSSGFCGCEGFADASTCTAAGYGSGITDCCLCQAAPIIDYISPAGGFCKINTNIYCGADDSICDAVSSGDSCDIQTANASAGSLVTISGRYFGSYAAGESKVEFNGIVAQLAQAANSECVNSWTGKQIIVVLPAGLALSSNPTIKVTASGGNSDTNTDARGAKIDFLVNDIDRPGLCALSPEQGGYNDAITFHGLSLDGAAAFFGTYSSNIKALDPVFVSALSGTAKVPNLSNSGKVTVFAVSDEINSNYLDFTNSAPEKPGPYIISFSPAHGPAKQYVTVMGGGFGGQKGKSKVYFDENLGNNTGASPDFGTEANYDFPKECQQSVWSDNQVIVKVPDNGLDDGDYYLVMDLEGAKEAIDTSMTFTTGPVADPTFQYKSSDSLLPSLCRIDPVRGQANSDITLWGEYFGAYENGKSLVRFYSQKDRSVSAGDWDVSKKTNIIKAAVHQQAITGPVAVVNKDDKEGNGLLFTVGACAKNEDCGAGGICCPAGSTESGLCASDKNGDAKTDELDCYAGLSSSVYEWQFSTGLGGIGDSCDKDQSNAVCEKDDNLCSDKLVCANDCTCQMPCDMDAGTPACDSDNSACSDPDYPVCDTDTCFCARESAGSCQERSKQTNTCDPQVCPNSPGNCSFYDSAQNSDKEIGGICGNQSCASIPFCGENGCRYDKKTDRCVSAAEIDCSRPQLDFSGKTVTAYCSIFNEQERWHINTAMSCPSGWKMLLGGKCVQLGNDGLCDLCASGFICRNIDEDPGGECVAPFDICPSGFYCDEDRSNCLKDARSSCECCCRLPNGNTDYSNQDCCLGLTCAGSCGSDRTMAADEDGDGDNADYGYCSGCATDADSDGAIGSAADIAASDEKCNCLGTSGKYCDLSMEGGACRDCATIAGTDDCSDHSGSCCVDNKNGDNCRGNDGVAPLSESGLKYCAYYECAADKNSCAKDFPAKNGAYKTLPECESGCRNNSSNNLGLYCAINNSCDDSFCLNPFQCLNDSGASTPGDCGFCCCDPSQTGDDDECKLAGLPALNCRANQSPCSGDNRGLCCGCEKDSDCDSNANPIGVGCGTDSCCRARPSIVSAVPADGSESICRNAEIIAEFNQEMDISSFSGNVLLLGDYGPDPCPAGTQYLAHNGRAELKRGLLSRLAWHARELMRQTISLFSEADKARAFTAINSDNNFCAVPGNSGGYNDSGGKGILRFAPTKLLDPERLYYVVIKGDDALLDGNSQGVKSEWGIGMNGGINAAFNGVNYRNSYVFSFRTLGKQALNNGICELHRVDIDPSSYLFRTNVNDGKDDDVGAASFDTVDDSDKIFTAYANALDGQSLAPIAGVYSWTMSWTTNNSGVADFVPVPLGDKYQLVRADSGKTEGEAVLTAKADYDPANSFIAPEPEPGNAYVYLFVCQNPWPPVRADGTWSPWLDQENNCLPGTGSCGMGYNFNFKFYYCRDSGNIGTHDDLPAILSGQGGSPDKDAVIRGLSSVRLCSLSKKPCINDGNCSDGEGSCQNQYLKEFYFFRENVPEATTSISVINKGDGQSAAISWPKIAGVYGYKLYWGRQMLNYSDYAEVLQNAQDDAENLACVEKPGSPALIECELNGLTNETKYFFNLTSFFNTGSESGQFGEKLVLISDIQAPDAPIGFKASPDNAKAVLSWDAVSGAAGYKVYYGVISRVYGGSVDVGKDQSVIISKLTNGQKYFFAVTAYDKDKNESDYSLENAVIPAAPNCGDSVCQPAGECSSCDADCELSDCCGNGACDSLIGESRDNCADCAGGVVCGNGICENGETNAGCPADCFCGNNTCDSDESPMTCDEDCPVPSGPSIPPPSCGSPPTCDEGEDHTNCPSDCPE